jgi:hypothetical protein
MAAIPEIIARQMAELRGANSQAAESRSKKMKNGGHEAGRLA